jgi:flagellar biosynthesis/type III secretory pathway chaperone
MSQSPSAATGGLDPHPARALLTQLAELLEAERQALVELDRDAIEDFAQRKLELDQALTEMVRERALTEHEQPLLSRVRERALQNQLLLAHARSCVQGALSLLSPTRSPGYTVGPSPSSPPPVAVDFRR